MRTRRFYSSYTVNVCDGDIFILLFIMIVSVILKIAITIFIENIACTADNDVLLAS